MLVVYAVLANTCVALITPLIESLFTSSPTFFSTTDRMSPDIEKSVKVERLEQRLLLS